VGEGPARVLGRVTRAVAFPRRLDAWALQKCLHGVDLIAPVWLAIERTTVLGAVLKLRHRHR
jgi:hypothetical protein